MPVSRKSTVPVSTKQSPGKAAAPAARPFLRFYHSQELRVRTLAVLLAVESADEATAYSGDLSELVLELTNSGLDQYFLQPLKATKVSFVVQQSAALGMSGVHKVMGTVIRNVLGRMDDRQLLSVCGSIRKLMT
jgi:hypothetical protein